MIRGITAKEAHLRETTKIQISDMAATDLVARIHTGKIREEVAVTTIVMVGDLAEILTVPKRRPNCQKVMKKMKLSAQISSQL